MRILMLGNSFTFFNDMPDMLAELTGAEVVAQTRGGARLSEQLNPNTRMGAAPQAALREEAALSEASSAAGGEMGLCGTPGDEQRPHHQSGVLFQQRHPPV